MKFNSEDEFYDKFDRFDECYTSSGRMREFCKVYGANIVFKRKEQWEHQKETD